MVYDINVAFVILNKCLSLLHVACPKMGLIPSVCIRLCNIGVRCIRLWIDCVVNCDSSAHNLNVFFKNKAYEMLRWHVFSVILMSNLDCFLMRMIAAATSTTGTNLS